MALTLLPQQLICHEFLRLRRICFLVTGKIGEKLQLFSTYFYNTWIKGHWTSSDWCQFEQIHRTNNISESHNGAFKKRLFYGDMTFYSIVGKLFNESKTVPYILTEVYSLEGRTVSRKVLKSESLLMLLWDNLKNKKIKAAVFLQAVTTLKILDVNEKWSFQECRNILV